MGLKNATAADAAIQQLGFDNEILASASSDNAQTALNVAVGAEQQALISAIVVTSNGITNRLQADLQLGGASTATFWVGDQTIIVFPTPIDGGKGNDVDLIIPASGTLGEIVDAFIVGKVVTP